MEGELHCGLGFQLEHRIGNTIPKPRHCSTVDIHGIKGQLITVFTTGCWGISAPEPGPSPPWPSSLTWVSAGLTLSYSHSSLV